MVLQNNEAGVKYKKINRERNLQEVRVLPKDVDLKANVLVLPDKVIITQIVDPIVCVKIENKSIVEMQRQQFNIIWDSIKEN
jgi:hypothetical protein